MNVFVERLGIFLFDNLKREKELMARDLAKLKPDLAVAGTEDLVFYNNRIRRLVKERRLLRKQYADLNEQLSLFEQELCSPHKMDRPAENLEPPRTAEMLVGALTKKRYRDALLMDLDEAFRRDVTSGMSVERARKRYWAAALNSVGPQVWAAARRIGLLGLLADYARRLFH
ncbi:hypothetical protein [Methylosinus sp. Ce-a6]|uniref:hypothetical protein n=1 Tax=Methylosinus sp. Ce-a6 TaxID=2172005 RepID=UPI00135C6D15|nr:hypothetical protein [Methylosinus sp. Ce-a6]